MLPIILPSATNPAWGRAKQIVAAFRARGKHNPLIVAALANSYGESSWSAVIAGDHGKSFGPWQCNWTFYGESILEATGIDIRTEPSFDKHVEAVLFALGMHANLPTLAALEAAKTGAEATRIWAHDFERASAGGAVDRRVGIAPAIVVWLANSGV